MRRHAPPAEKGVVKEHAVMRAAYRHTLPAKARRQQTVCHKRAARVSSVTNSVFLLQCKVPKPLHPMHTYAQPTCGLVECEGHQALGVSHLVFHLLPGLHKATVLSCRQDAHTQQDACEQLVAHSKCSSWLCYISRLQLHVPAACQHATRSTPSPHDPLHMMPFPIHPTTSRPPCAA